MPAACSELMERTHGFFENADHTNPHRVRILSRLEAHGCPSGHLWGVTEEICGAAMDALIGEGFLRRAASGAYFALPRPHGSALKADAAASSVSRRRRCPHCRKLQEASADD